MNEETKITHESLDNLNEAIKSNIGNDNKPTKFLNVSGVYKYNNVNYTRPLRTDKYGNLKIANDSTEAQEVTNPTLTNLNNTIKNNAVTVNVNNLDSLSITDEFLEKQNLSAFQDVSKEAQKLRNDASTFPKLLVHNVRPETTPVVNQTDKNNDIIPLNCNVDNTIETGQVIKPLQSTIRALPASAAEDPDVQINPDNLSRHEIMADSTSDGAGGLKHPNALQTVDQNLKTVLGSASVHDTGKLKTVDQNLKTVFGSASVHDTGKLKTVDQNLKTVLGSASVNDNGKLKTEDQGLKYQYKYLRLHDHCIENRGVGSTPTFGTGDDDVCSGGFRISNVIDFGEYTSVLPHKYTLNFHVFSPIEYNGADVEQNVELNLQSHSVNNFDFTEESSETSLQNVIYGSGNFTYSSTDKHWKKELDVILQTSNYPTARRPNQTVGNSIDVFGDSVQKGNRTAFSINLETYSRYIIFSYSIKSATELVHTTLYISGYFSEEVEIKQIDSLAEFNTTTAAAGWIDLVSNGLIIERPYEINTANP